MRKKRREELERLDDFFYKASKKLNLLRYVNPLNSSEQKRLFFEGEVRNPLFVYKTVDYDVEELRRSIEKVEIAKSDYREVFERLRREYLIRCDALSSLKSGGSVKEHSLKIYGAFNDSLVEYAHKIVSGTNGLNRSFYVGSDVVASFVRKMLNEVGLVDWSVELTQNCQGLSPSRKSVCFLEDDVFSGYDVSRVAMHEVVHATRCANSYLQPLKVFLYGFAHFLDIEEGLAVFLEEVSGSGSPWKMRIYAGRVLALDFLLKGYDFRACFEGLVNLGFSSNDAWDLSLRAYRGRGFVKDHIYLEGYVQIKNFVENGGDLRKLFVGRVGIGDLVLVDSLIDKGVVKKPRFFPNFIV